MPWGILHYKVSREKFEPELGFESLLRSYNVKFSKAQIMSLFSINNLMVYVFSITSVNSFYKIIYIMFEADNQFMALQIQGGFLTSITIAVKSVSVVCITS